MARLVRRGPLAAVVVFAMAAAALIAMSCKSLPGKTCYGDKINAFADSPDAGACTTCMQSNTCCDLVGACGDHDPCAAEFKATQECLAEGGPAAESDCKTNLKTTTGQDLYACVRKGCGSECGIPSCDLNSAVVLIVQPSCDRCITGACCEAMNACYGNRQCQLFTECITKRCPVTLGTSMTRAGKEPHDAIAESKAYVCGAPDARFDPGLDPGPCLQRCLDEFAPASGTSDDRAARCLAFGVYTCGAAAGCGSSCLNDGGASASSDLPYPEDGVDSGAR